MKLRMPLDFSTEKKVCNNIINKNNKSTVFFITHRLQVIKNADLIIVFHKGRIDEIGTHEELVAMKGRYFALIGQSYEF